LRPKVHTEKHIVQQTVASVATAAIATVNIAFAKKAPTTAAIDVREGSSISAVFVEMWITSDDAAQGSTVVTLEKRPSLAPSMSYAQSIALDTYPNKNNVFYTTMGLTPPNVQSGIPFIRQWFKIPKGKQRFGQDDILVINISGITNGANYCGFFTFKEQY